jgi:hypothetical protein
LEHEDLGFAPNLDVPIFSGPQRTADINGLLALGTISEDFVVWGHTFKMRTIRLGEELVVGQIVKPYTDTIQQGKAYAAAMVAASLEMVDGRPLFAALGPSIETVRQNIQNKFEYVQENWYFTLVEELYGCYLTLLERQLDAFEELSGKSQRTPQPSSPYAGS